MSPAKWLRALSLLAALGLFLPILSACGAGGSGTTLRVGTKNFTEEYIVGEMYKLLLEEAGFKVELKKDLTTPTAQAAMVAKELDLYPEYTGTGLTTVLSLPANSDQKAVFDAVTKGYKEKFNFVWLDAAPMNNTQAFAMTQEKSKQYGVTTLSQLVAKANQLVMAGPVECPERDDCVKGMKKAYGDFSLKEFKAVDSGLRYPALTQGQADVIVAFGTDGQIAKLNLVILQDDKRFLPPYQIAPVVRQEILDKNPKLKDALNKLAPKLTDDVMRRLNNEVDGNSKEPAAVAKQFLQEQGLIKK